jgi:hypothetical protein
MPPPEAAFIDSLSLRIRRVVGLEAAMVSTDHFRHELLAQLGRAAKQGRIDILVNSGDLYRSLGGYPDSTHGMPRCCDAMQDEFRRGDTMILDRDSGAGMTVRYLLPRIS